MGFGNVSAKFPSYLLSGFLDLKSRLAAIERKNLL